MGEKNQPANLLIPVTARGEATRRKILDAAEEVFGEVGYYAASISEITRRAGVAQGTYYIYFHSKREIFVELVQDIGKRVRADTRAAIASAANRLEAEQKGFMAFFKFVARHRHIYSIVQEAERIAPEAFYAYYHSISQGYAQGLSEAVQEEHIRCLHPEAIAYALMGIGHFVALRWLIWSREHEGSRNASDELPEDVFQAVMEFIAHGLTPQDQLEHKA